MRTYFRKSIDDTENTKEIGEEGEAYIQALLDQMTLDEKIGMIHGCEFFRNKGIERLGIPPITMSDGPNGVRFEFGGDNWSAKNENDDYITYLPTLSALGATWNRSLAYDEGKALGTEFRGRGKDIGLGPGVNIKRDPLCGRNFEYMSEDPRVIEEMVVPFIRGFQTSDAAACVKHFAVNNQETERLSVDTEVSERALNEIYYPAFQAALQRGGAYTLMAAYNKFRGHHCCHSSELLDGVLREKWGFDGAVISDWGGVHDTIEAGESSLDLEMSVTTDFDDYFMAEPLKNKVLSGDVTIDKINAKILHLLRTMYRIRMIGPEAVSRKAGTYNAWEHRRIAREVADESVVLLKNEGELLPLNAGKLKKLAVIGWGAQAQHAMGGGSSELRALYEISPLLGIKMALGGNTEVVYEKGYEPDVVLDKPINWQEMSTKITSSREKKVYTEAEQQHLQELRERALEAAKNADAVIYVGGLDRVFDSEGFDRESMKLPYQQDELIRELLAVRPDTVIALQAGAPVEMPWVQDAKAIVWSYYYGEEGGSSLANVLFGRLNPSGKITESFIKTAADAPAHINGTFGQKERIEYEEGVYVGYRYYDTHSTAVNFPFGHGLSYTKFDYSELSITKVSGHGGSIHVRFYVENVGREAGKEIVQLYVRPLNPAVDRPFHELKAFEKIAVNAGEKVEVTLSLAAVDFSYYDEGKAAFVVDHGEYAIEIGASSRDIRLEGKLKI